MTSTPTNIKTPTTSDSDWDLPQATNVATRPVERSAAPEPCHPLGTCGSTDAAAKVAHKDVHDHSAPKAVPGLSRTPANTVTQRPDTGSNQRHTGIPHPTELDQYTCTHPTPHRTYSQQTMSPCSKTSSSSNPYRSSFPASTPMKHPFPRHNVHSYAATYK